MIKKIAASGLFILFAMYFSVAIMSLFMSQQSGVQLIHMADLKDSQFANFLQMVYTVLLGLSSVGLFYFDEIRNQTLKYLVFGCTFSVVLLTALPLIYSYFYTWAPGFYENYVGEGLTILLALIGCVLIPLQAQPNKAFLRSVWPRLVIDRSPVSNPDR